MMNRPMIYSIGESLSILFKTFTVVALLIATNAESERTQDWLTISDAATYLNVTERFIRRLIAEHRVTFHHFGRHIRFQRSDLDAFAKAGRIEARS